MSASELLIVANAVVLGFRHGIDWDHIAALMDITASSSVVTGQTATFAIGEKRALWLSCLYALGHCAVVILIGMITCFFAGMIPAGLDQIMETVVGLTLVVFGIVIAFITAKMMQTGSALVPVSRMHVLVGGLRKSWQLMRGQIKHDVDLGPTRGFSYGKRTAFGLGILHGAGVETASQIVLLAAIGASASKFFAACVLTAFSFGFLASIMLIAFFGVQGMKSIVSVRPLYLISTALTALFSIAIGMLLLTGGSSILPDLSKRIF